MFQASITKMLVWLFNFFLCGAEKSAEVDIFSYMSFSSQQLLFQQSYSTGHILGRGGKSIQRDCRGTLEAFVIQPIAAVRSETGNLKRFQTLSAPISQLLGAQQAFRFMLVILVYE